MTILKDQKGRIAIFAIALVGIVSPIAYGGGEPLPTSDVSDSKVVPTEDLGTGNYSRFPFHVSASVRGGYDDNITTSQFNRQESWFTNAGVALTYDFGSPRTQLSLQVGGGATYYWDNPSRDDSFNNQDYDVNAYVSLTLTHKASPRLSFAASVYATYQTEPDFTLALGLNRRSGNFFFTQDKFTATYLWSPRFATATSYTFGALRYDDNNIGFFEDRIENTFGNEFKFLLWPTTSLVAEYRFQIVNYDENIDRDSTTHFVLGGFDHSFSPRFSASFRGGAEFRDYEGETRDQSSPYFEGTLNYALGKDTSISWTNRYAIEESDVLINPSRTTFRTGLRLKHNFTQRISMNAAAYYENDEYDGVDTSTAFSPSFSEEAFDAAVSLRYAITRHFAVEAGYNHTEIWSDITLREYSRNRYWGGLNVVF
ncbi:MAG: outer membrane beta-barrel protein [Spartobacteria bacterium]